MKIREANIYDVEDISRIYALSWKAAYKGMVPQTYLDNLREDFWVSAFSDWISNEILNVKVICDEEKMLGCIAYGKSRDEKFEDWGEIVSLYMLPQYYGKGYGTKLIKNALNDLEYMGFNKIYLWVLEENFKSKKFYEKNGFISEKEKCSYFISEKELIHLRFIYKIK
ncbi:GNAT family N-acetyltransferase [Anaerovorax sp. IOR16]|uniref:GNAT family N-acetyltransferase n=1 Tax=Anaerovorax sp. IOR16 TaxID=2773458 RepID=UPI0019D00DCE|nr:GNAT family N-acetyltransferase [Anaerovorax sp. IOR16]